MLQQSLNDGDLADTHRPAGPRRLNPPKLICGSLLAFALVLSSMSTAGASTHKKPITVKQAAKQYLADVGPVNTAMDKFSAALTKWGDANGTAAQTTVFVKPAVAALKTFDHRVLTQRWPTKAAGAVETLASDTAAISGDISGLPAVNILSESKWSTTFDRDFTILGTAANIVRKDLGLPLTQSGTTSTTTTTTSARSEAQLTVTWNIKTGLEAFGKIFDDFQAMRSSADGSDLDGDIASCQSLDNDVSSIMAESPIPIASIETLWMTALNELRTGASECVNAFDNLEEQLGAEVVTAQGIADVIEVEKEVGDQASVAIGQ
jgi:hypothetical protein